MTMSIARQFTLSDAFQEMILIFSGMGVPEVYSYNTYITDGPWRGRFRFCLFL